MYLTYFQNLSIKVPAKFETYKKLLGILKAQFLIRKCTHLPAHSLYSSPSMKLNLFFNHYETPCILENDEGTEILSEIFSKDF